MKIAQIAPLYEAVPPRLYGGTERVVAALCDALVGLGHEVTLFASAEAQTRATLVAMRDQAIRLDPAPLTSDLAAHLCQLAEVRARAGEFDLLHFHTDMIHLSLFEEMAPKTLTTLHGRLDIKDLAKVYERWNSFPLVSISDAQRAPMPTANWAGTVHHGLAPDAFRFSPSGAGYLAFLGRISPEKRVDRAIRIAQRLGRTLRIAAKVDRADRAYFETAIEPHLTHPLVDYIGEIGDGQKSAFLGGADALLFPIDWPEPFGLVMIEAMACGTPVVAFPHGSAPEVVEPGLTGFLVSSEEEALEAVAKAATLDRAAIRRRFEERFSSRAMARAYAELYASCGAARGDAPSTRKVALA
jgi:glycosyltransferase involved in cell wall biosynthesis